MAFTMSYGATDVPAAKAAAPVAKKPAKPRVRTTPQSKADALFGPAKATDPDPVGTDHPAAA